MTGAGQLPPGFKYSTPQTPPSAGKTGPPDEGLLLEGGTIEGLKLTDPKTLRHIENLKNQLQILQKKQEPLQSDIADRVNASIIAFKRLKEMENYTKGKTGKVLYFNQKTGGFIDPNFSSLFDDYLVNRTKAQSGVTMRPDELVMQRGILAPFWASQENVELNIKRAQGDIKDIMKTFQTGTRMNVLDLLNNLESINDVPFDIGAGQVEKAKVPFKTESPAGLPEEKEKRYQELLKKQLEGTLK